MSFTLTQNLKSFRTIPYLNLVEPLSAAPVAVTYTAKGVDSINGTDLQRCFLIRRLRGWRLQASSTILSNLLTLQQFLRMQKRH